jgi:hypothetical protein
MAKQRDNLQMQNDLQSITGTAAGYMRFLGLSQDARAKGLLADLGAADIEVLHGLARHWLAGESPSVLNTVLSNDHRGPSSVHRALKRLRELGYVTLVMDEQDNHVKYVRPTARAMEYFEVMGGCLEQAQG